MSTDRVAGVALLVLGIGAVAVGLAGLAGVIGGPTVSPAPSTGPTSAAPSVGSSASSSAAPVPTATSPPAPSPSPGSSAGASPSASPGASPSPDLSAQVEPFIRELEAAIRAGDLLPMLDDLHPAVIDRYGETACQSTLATRSADPAYAVAIREVRPQAAWDWVLDERTTTIPDAWTIVADVTATDPATGAAATSQREVHVAPAGGTVRWFTDCGTPTA
jgi:hypothetical protein